MQNQQLSTCNLQPPPGHFTSILGRLPLIPAGDHGTIPAAMRNRKKELFEYGKCDKSARPGSGSKLYYINSWAMCWPSDHAKKPLTG